MPCTLITFLGRVSEDQQRYRTTQYSFEGEKDPPSAFVGLNLVRRLHPDRAVVLGTSGSMWDHLFEEYASLGDAAEDQRLALTDAVSLQRVAQEMLEPLAPLLQAHWGCEVLLRVIPYGRTQAEQVQVLQAMAGDIGEGDTVTLDVTHGFRHLPMLGLLSAMHLRLTRRAVIDHIYYGAYDPDTGEAPVYDLAGALHIANWVEALSKFDKDGDYSVFTRLLEEDGLQPVDANFLRRAGFYERTTNARDAQKELANFGRALQRGLPGTGALFAGALAERTQWHRGRDLAEQQGHLARTYLERGDYMRAAMFGYEAFVTRLVEPGERPDAFEDRKHATESYEGGGRGEHRRRDDFRRLKRIRNTLAHGTESSDRKVMRMLGDEALLRAELTRLLDALLP